MKKLLEIKNLKKYYHDTKGEVLAIDNISLTINENDFISIVGTSGCGKSTLLSILAGIENKSDGELKFNKDNFKIGYMLQKDSLFPWRTILDNCLIGLEINHSLTKEKKDKVISLLNKEIFLQGTDKDNEAFGYQEMWAEYRMMPDQISGELRSNYDQSLDIWHYGDDYSTLPSLGSDWIKEPEENMARTLAVQSHDQFFADFYFEPTYALPMPLYSVPGLIDHH